MQLKKEFDVEKPRDAAATVVAQDDTLVRLFPDAKVEIVETHGNERTVVTHYTLLGQPGKATFTFTVENSGDITFEKHCDGKVWKDLKGSVRLTDQGDGTRVHIGTVGHTKAFVPEFAIRGPMQEQIDQMAEALHELIETRA